MADTGGGTGTGGGTPTPTGGGSAGGGTPPKPNPNPTGRGTPTPTGGTGGTPPPKPNPNPTGGTSGGTPGQNGKWDEFLKSLSGPIYDDKKLWGEILKIVEEDFKSLNPENDSGRIEEIKQYIFPYINEKKISEGQVAKALEMVGFEMSAKSILKLIENQKDADVSEYLKNNFENVNRLKNAHKKRIMNLQTERDSKIKEANNLKISDEDISQVLLNDNSEEAKQYKEKVTELLNQLEGSVSHEEVNKQLAGLGEKYQGLDGYFSQVEEQNKSLENILKEIDENSKQQLEELESQYEDKNSEEYLKAIEEFNNNLEAQKLTATAQSNETLQKLEESLGGDTKKQLEEYKNEKLELEKKLEQKSKEDIQSEINGLKEVLIESNEELKKKQKYLEVAKEKQLEEIQEEYDKKVTQLNETLDNKQEKLQNYLLETYKKDIETFKENQSKQLEEDKKILEEVYKDDTKKLNEKIKELEQDYFNEFEEYQKTQKEYAEKQLGYLENIDLIAAEELKLKKDELSEQEKKELLEKSKHKDDPEEKNKINSKNEMVESLNKTSSLEEWGSVLGEELSKKVLSGAGKIAEKIKNSKLYQKSKETKDYLFSAAGVLKDRFFNKAKSIGSKIKDKIQGSKIYQSTAEKINTAKDKVSEFAGGVKDKIVNIAQPVTSKIAQMKENYKNTDFHNEVLEKMKAKKLGIPTTPDDTKNGNEDDVEKNTINGDVGTPEVGSKNPKMEPIPSKVETKIPKPVATNDYYLSEISTISYKILDFMKNKWGKKEEVNKTGELGTKGDPKKDEDGKSGVGGLIGSVLGIVMNGFMDSGKKLLSKVSGLGKKFMGKIKGAWGKVKQFSSKLNPLNLFKSETPEIDTDDDEFGDSDNSKDKGDDKGKDKKKTSGKSKNPDAKKKIGKKVKKPSGKSILSKLKEIKGKIFKKFGKKGGAKIAAKLSAKMAARAVPFVGAGLLAYDAAKIAYMTLHDKIPLKDAISKQFLGFDIFDDDDLPETPDGEPEVDPEESKEVKDVESKDVETQDPDSPDLKQKADTTTSDTIKGKVLTGGAAAATATKESSGGIMDASSQTHNIVNNYTINKNLMSAFALL